MNVNNWEFYIVPTKIINEQCGKNKTIGLNKVKQISLKNSTQYPLQAFKMHICTFTTKLETRDNLYKKVKLIDFKIYQITSNNALF